MMPLVMMMVMMMFSRSRPPLTLQNIFDFLVVFDLSREQSLNVLVHLMQFRYHHIVSL